MSGRITVWGAQQLLTTYFAKINEPPTSFYLALVKDIAPTPYMDGSELTEPDAPDYARVELPNSVLYWANTLPQEITNTDQVSFTTATTDWGAISYWALCNAAVDGYNLIVGELETPILVAAGDQVVLAAGDLSASLGPFFLSEEA